MPTWAAPPPLLLLPLEGRPPAPQAATSAPAVMSPAIRVICLVHLFMVLPPVAGELVLRQGSGAVARRYGSCRPGPRGRAGSPVRGGVRRRAERAGRAEGQ